MNALTPYTITPIGNFVGVVLALLPLLSQIRKLSLAVWGYAMWIAVMNFQTFVDTIIWHDNVSVVAPVWCDIGEKRRCCHSELYSPCDCSDKVANWCRGRHSCIGTFDLHPPLQNYTHSRFS